MQKHLNKLLLRLLLTFLSVACLTACDSVVEDRIPSMPVSIDLSNAGTWSTYGVAGFGDCQYFIFISGEQRLPSGFPYKTTSATGFGGVLLICGMDPFSLETLAPLAYDLSCPVERQRNIRVAVDPKTYEAVCPVCDSHYDVTMGGGAPTAGPALSGEHKYGLRRYSCRMTTYGGYIITDLK